MTKPLGGTSIGSSLVVDLDHERQVLVGPQMSQLAQMIAGAMPTREELNAAGAHVYLNAIRQAPSDSLLGQMQEALRAGKEFCHIGSEFTPTDRFCTPQN